MINHKDSSRKVSKLPLKYPYTHKLIVTRKTSTNELIKIVKKIKWKMLKIQIKVLKNK